MPFPTRWLLLIAAIVTLYYSPLLVTDSYSFLLDKDDVNQAVSWHRHIYESLPRTLPLWDRNTQGGRSFIGEMQTALFYFPKWPMYFLPPSLRVQHVFFVLAHILAGCFMFLLARDLGLEALASSVAGVTFSLAGYMGGPVAWGWPHMIDAGIWLPLVLLFVRRALRGSAVSAAYAGLALSMPVLAGGLHVAIMDVLVVICLAATVPRRAIRVLAIVGIVSFCGSAVQVLPSIEYSATAERYINDTFWLPATQKIPYDQILYNYPPRAVLAFLWGRAPIGLAEFSPYFGILGLAFAVAGAWRYRNRPAVRYLAAGGGLAFLYGLGASFPLHRVLYEILPYLWLAKEPARFIYLTHTAMALLVGFGVNRMRALYASPLLLLMLVDWRYFNTSIQRRSSHDYLAKMESAAGLAKFLKRQPGFFRINVAGNEPPNIGDFYGLQTTSGLGAVRSLDYKNFWQQSNAADLMNVRYFICPTPECPAGVTPSYRDADWTAIENTDVLHSAWLEPSGVPAKAVSYGTNTFSVQVHADSPALLVLSENYSPGWHAEVNGLDRPIQKVHGTLRGILVPEGNSRVELRYQPLSLTIGGVLSFIALLLVLAAARKTRASNAGSSSDSPPGLRASRRSSGRA